MAIETRKKTIDNVEIAVTHLPARTAMRLKIKLVKLLSPSIGQIFGGLGKVSKNTSLLDLEIDMSLVSTAIEKLSERLDEQEFENLIFEILACTRLDGREIDTGCFDTEFAGNLNLMYKIIWFTLEVNYGSFFGANGIGMNLKGLTKGNQNPMPESSEN